ncbi:TPM domain-containing protein [Flavobacterium sediminilitoris]|uniref:TPM domain-containing protein n=1 Tax=Flavobacterium sediminilitoris TaxID=2024526 RepID=A0ABY4HK34_9FLAO|nr:MULTISPECIES: TPM domain-containing protein [Flavobacterium]UOX32687.1 TPM domain-containing protein [Flavobacterium sediminilitoris]
METNSLSQKTEQTESNFPKQIGFINDFENIFTEAQEDQLTKFLSYYQNTSNREIAVITIDSIPKSMEFDQYAIKISENWKVGKNNNGNGLTVVLSRNLKTIRISTTDKTKQLYLSDEFCKKVIDENMIPEFKKGNYYDGILLGLNELIRKWL